MRVWLLSSTFYGNWLPGDRRGSVTRVRERRPGESVSQSRQQHNTFATPFDRDLAGLEGSALRLMKGDPVTVNEPQAEVLIAQFQETARYRQWHLLSAAVMFNHVHWVVEVVDDPDPDYLLRDFKSYGSRALNRRWPRPKSETWWTQGGSKRIRKTPRGRSAAVVYVAFKQPKPLASYLDPKFPLPTKYEDLRLRIYDVHGLKVSCK